MKTEDKIGMKFGRWTVLKVVCMGRDPKIEVVCDCGTRKILLSKTVGPDNPNTTQSKSCGCYHRERVTKPLNIERSKLLAVNYIRQSYKGSALQRGYHFLLSKNDIHQINFKNCFYCGKPPNRELKFLGFTVLVNGIDRVDNSRGYCVQNVEPCCNECNRKKGFITMELVEKIYKRETCA